MPELLQSTRITLTAPYGTSELKLEVASVMTFDALDKATSLGLEKMSVNQASFKKMPLKKQIDMGLSALFVLAEDWDLTHQGKPVPLTKENFQQLPVPTLMGFMNHPNFTRAMTAFKESANGLAKSGSGDLPGAHVRRTGKHAKGRKGR